MIETESIARMLRFAIQEIDSLPPDSGVTAEHLIFVRETLAGYLKHVEKNPKVIPPSDLSCASRLVIEYWPLSLPAGDAVLAAEQAMRKFAKRFN